MPFLQAMNGSSGGGGGGNSGLRLAVPTNVAIVNADEAASLTWTDPTDLVIDGTTRATWAGTYIVRKTVTPPTGIDDGTVVYVETIRNSHTSTPFTDTGLTNGTKYYYGIFPITTDGAVTNTVVETITPSAIVPNAPVITEVKGKNQQAIISFTSSTVGANVKFVFKVGSAPESATDGTVYSGYSSSPATVTGLTNDTTYYVAAYAYNSKRDSLQSNVETVMPSDAIRLAFHYSENNSSPDSVTYPEGYDNSSFTDPFYVNLSNGVPHYGDWDFTTPELSWLLPKSCMLKYDGTVDYYLDEDDETKRADGVTASDVADVNYGGNAMMEWGQDGKKIYWKIMLDQDGKGFTFVVANKATDVDMKAWNHYDCDGNLTDHFYTPKYYGSSDGTRLRSISGSTNSTGQDRATEISRALANNVNDKVEWYTEVYADYLLLAMLCVLISKSTNTQAKFGKGNTGGGNQIGQGTMNGKGLFFGSSNNYGIGVKVFGMENPWGNIWRCIAGLINDHGAVKIKLTYGTEDGSSANGYNTDGTGYLVNGSTGGGENYINHMNITTKGITPNSIIPSGNTSYYCDMAWFNTERLAYGAVGGDKNNGDGAGIFSFNLPWVATAKESHLGACLSCKPLATVA